MTGDDDFGLHLAEDVRDTRRFDAGLLLLMASPTVRVALEWMVHHQRLWGNGDRATLVRVPGGSRVRYTPRPVPTLATPTSAPWPRSRSAFASSRDGIISGRARSGFATRPRSLEEHRRLLGCQLTFRETHTELELDDAVCDTPMQHANAAFFAVFEAQVEQALARLPSVAGASEGVRSAVRAALASGGCTLAGTARGLGVSTRTMQRRLEAEGTSFAAVVDALRRELACAYLDRRVPIPEIAALQQACLRGHLLESSQDVPGRNSATMSSAGSPPSRRPLPLARCSRG